MFEAKKAASFMTGPTALPGPVGARRERRDTQQPY